MLDDLQEFLDRVLGGYDHYAGCGRAKQLVEGDLLAACAEGAIRKIARVVVDALLVFDRIVGGREIGADGREHFARIERVDEVTRVAERSSRVALERDRPVGTHHVFRRDAHPVKNRECHRDRASGRQHHLVTEPGGSGDLRRNLIAERAVFAKNRAVNVECDQPRLAHATGDMSSRPPR